MVSGEPSNPAAALAELRARLQAALVAKRMTKAALTRRAKLGRTSVSRAFSMSAPAPSAQTVSSMAAALGLDSGPLLKLRAVAVSGAGRENSEARERLPHRSDERLHGSEDSAPAHRGVDRPLGGDLARSSNENRRAALMAYAHRVRQTYANLELDVLTPLSDQSDHPPVALREVFVVPGLRADPPPVELPRELVHRLMESGDLAEETEPPEETAREVFVVPGLKADARPVEFPRELVYRLMESGDLAEELEPTEERESPAEEGESSEYTRFWAAVRVAADRLKDSYRRKPVVDALTVLTSDEARRTVLLGDPGAGKSTLARYLALTMTRPGPPEGPLAALASYVPLLVELREYAAAEWRQRTFEDFIAHLHVNRGMAPPPSLTQQLLLCGQALVVFDGLDELFDPRIRRDTHYRIAAFAARYPEARVIVTSRTIGYQRAVLDGAGFSHHMLQDLDGPRISDFAHRWYAPSGRQDPDLGNRLAGQLVAAVTDSRPVRELAGNPLLLTILAIIGRRKVLPRDRRGAYEHAVTVLVAHWDQQAKHLEAQLPEAVANTLDALGERERTRLLQLLARAMQEGTGGIAGNHIHGSDLERLIGDHLRARYEIPRPLAATCSRAMIAQLRERNFILSRYGGEVYGFVHRAFLEYLAATDIIQRIKDDWDRTPKQYVEEIVTAHAADPAWHEVLLLLIGELGERAAAAAVDRILELHAARKDPADASHVVLALRALAEVGAVGGLARQSIAVIDAVTALLDASIGDSGPRDGPTVLLDENDSYSRPQVPAAAAAFQTFGPYWIGRDRYLRWYHLRGQFADASTEPAELAVALRPDPAELRRLATGSFYGPDREIFLKALADRWISHDETGEFLASRSASDPSPEIRRKLVDLLIAQWPHSPDVRARLKHCATRDPDSEVRHLVVTSLLLRWPDRADVRDLLVAVATEGSDTEAAQAATEALVARAPHDETLHPVLAHLAEEHASPLVRGTVLPLVLDCGNEDEARRLLSRRAVRDEDPDLRLAAIRTLERMWPQDDDVHSFLRTRATEDPAPLVRCAALTAWAAQCKDHEEVRAVLTARIVGEESLHLRLDALTALVDRQPDLEQARSLLAQRAAHDADPDVRAAALRRLIDHRPQQEEVWGRWAECMRREENGAVRRSAVLTLGEADLGRTEVRAVLAETAVGDTVPAVRWAAATALTQCGDAPDVRNALLALGRRETEADVRLLAVSHLSKGRMGNDDELASFLAERVREDLDPAVRRAILEAWTKGAGFPPAPASVFLAVAAEDTEPALRLVALTHLIDHHADDHQVRTFLLARVQEDLASNVMRTLLCLWDGDGPAPDEELSVLALVAANDPSEFNRWAAVGALVRRRPDEEWVRALLADRAAHDSSPRLRWAAALALVQRLPIEQAGRTLAERVEHDPDRDVRWAALSKLVQEVPVDDEGRELLIRLASGDEHPTMRWQALALLIVHRPADPDLRAVLTERVEHDPDRDVRWAALKTLADLWNDDEVCARFAAHAAEDPDADLRWAAAVVIVNRWPDHSAVAVERLRAQACSAPDAASRWLALAALVEMPSAAEGEPLLAIRAESDSDSSIRHAAFDVCIGALPPGGSLAAFGRSMDERLLALQSRLLTAADDGRLVAERSAVHDPDPEIRRRVLAMIALHWPDRRTTGLLADRATEDGESEVRAYANRLLGMLRER
ncbi:HEAT repeat domain-containing protein [Streptomyces sp. NPDC002962]|uniref:HEAT repeat domain-containing protein n=1 Tax=Streptomyces sp. NPDC002962 TaxID=3364674 RepID=UPI0036B84C3F